MKQKIVIKVGVHCEKSRSKALKIAAVARGVSSVSLEGADKDRVVVTGDGVDSVCLARALRKKFHHANILSVEEVKEKKKEETKPKEVPLPLPCYYYSQYPSCPPYVVYDPYARDCIIM